jgi:hypothetical protein
MIAALIFIGGILLIGAVLFWPGKRSVSGDSNNPFFIGDASAFKRRKRPHHADSGKHPGDSVGDSSDGSGH